MVPGYLWIAIEEALANTKNVNTGAGDDDQADAKENPKREHGIGVLVDDGDGINCHLTDKSCLPCTYTLTFTYTILESRGAS